MTYTSSYTSTTSSSLETSTTVSDDSSSSSLVVDATIETSSPDDSEGLSAFVGGDALAAGEDTLTMGTLSAAVVDGGAVTSADLSVTMIAAAESSDGETAALTDTFAEISDGADFLFTYTLDASQTEETESGTMASSTSTTVVAAYDLQLDDGGAAVGDSVADAPTDSSSLSGDGDESCGLDGNLAILDFDVVAIGEDTFVGVDAFVLAVEDQLSSSTIFVELAVG